MHHLINIVDANESYSVARFVNDACNVLRTGQTEGRRFLICGGTGQYISAVYECLKFRDIIFLCCIDPFIYFCRIFREYDITKVFG